MMQKDGEGFTAYVLRRRLARCAHLLSDPFWAHITIADIALRAGFNDLTHFERVFKQGYGCTPSEYRRPTRTGAA